MTKFCIGVVAQILLHLIPIAFIVTDLLAVCTDGHDTAQCPDLIQCLLEPSPLFFQRLLHLLALGDVSSCGN